MTLKRYYDVLDSYIIDNDELVNIVFGCLSVLTLIHSKASIEPSKVILIILEGT